jgi:hypothetical protein
MFLVIFREHQCNYVNSVARTASSIIILSLIAIICFVSCFILCNEDKEFLVTEEEQPEDDPPQPQHEQPHPDQAQSLSRTTSPKMHHHYFTDSAQIGKMLIHSVLSFDDI